MVYKYLIRSNLDYGSPVYGFGSEPTLRRLDVLQKECVRMCLGALRCTRVARMEVEADIPPLKHRRDVLVLLYGIKPPGKLPSATEQARSSGSTTTSTLQSTIQPLSDLTLYANKRA